MSDIAKEIIIEMNDRLSAVERKVEALEALAGKRRVCSCGRPITAETATILCSCGQTWPMDESLEPEPEPPEPEVALVACQRVRLGQGVLSKIYCQMNEKNGRPLKTIYFLCDGNHEDNLDPLATTEGFFAKGSVPFLRLQDYPDQAVFTRIADDKWKREAYLSHILDPLG